MKKFIACATVLLISMVMAGVAGAAPAHWSDTWTPDEGPIDFSYHDNHSFTFQHDLGRDGFDASLDEVDRYRLSIALQDDARHDGWEWAFIDLPGHRTDEAVEVGHHNVHLGWSWQGLASLNDNGLLEVTVYWLCGDFQLLGSHLCASGTESAAHAPIPGSVLLLASGLIGLVGYRRRLVS